MIVDGDNLPSPSTKEANVRAQKSKMSFVYILRSSIDGK
jgi:hypothetical protein